LPNIFCCSTASGLPGHTSRFRCFFHSLNLASFCNICSPDFFLHIPLFCTVRLSIFFFDSPQRRAMPPFPVFDFFECTQRSPLCFFGSTLYPDYFVARPLPGARSFSGLAPPPFSFAFFFINVFEPVDLGLVSFFNSPHPLLFFLLVFTRVPLFLKAFSFFVGRLPPVAGRHLAPFPTVLFFWDRPLPPIFSSIVCKDS